MRSLIPFLALVAFLFYSCGNEPNDEQTEISMDQFNSLIGTWHSALEFPRAQYEVWEKTENGLTGYSYSVNRLGDTTMMENLEIRVLGHEVVYLIEILGENSRFDTFYLDPDHEHISFTDEGNDFPQRVTYAVHDYGIDVTLSAEGADDFDLSFFKLNDAMAKRQNSMGSYVQIAIGVEDIKAEQEFFEKLGFETEFFMEEPYPFCQMTNGVLNLNLAKDGMIYIGLAYFGPDMNNSYQRVKEMGYSFMMEQTKDDGSLNFAVFDDPFGNSVAIIDEDPNSMTQPDFRKQCNLGQFGEYTLKTTDLNESMAWYESIGFANLGKFSMPYPWAVMSDGNIVIGLHQTDEAEFDVPSITFFSMNTKEIVAELREKGVEILIPEAYAEFGDNNAIAVSPGGNHVNLFFGTL